MRIWSLHPKYLDAKGLVALWRESLLAKQVLEGKTKGFKNHPQLNRFKNSGNAVGCINQYLTSVYENSLERGNNFNKNKVNPDFKPTKLTVTDKQIKFEMKHYLLLLFPNLYKLCFHILFVSDYSADSVPCVSSVI